MVPNVERDLKVVRITREDAQERRLSFKTFSREKKLQVLLDFQEKPKLRTELKPSIKKT